MTQSKHAYPVWRNIVASLLVLGLSLAGLQTVQAAESADVNQPVTFEDGSYPAGLVYGPGQSIWVTLSGTGEIGQVSGSGTTLHDLTAVDALPSDITLGPDQSLWFVEENIDRIGRLTSDGELAEFLLVDRAHPTSIALGQDLALWFTEREGNRIGRIEPTGALTYFELPHADSRPESIVSAPDGSLWFTDWENRIGKINLQGEISTYSDPDLPNRPVNLLIGPDGQLWIIFNIGKTIARFDPASESFVTYPLATDSSSLSDLSLGPDGRIWFVGTQTVGSFDVIDGCPQNLTEEPLTQPVFSYQGRSQIIAGPDNDLFFTTANTSNLYRTELDGSPALRDLQVFITYQPPLLLASGPFSIDAEIVNWTNSDATDVQIDLIPDESIHFVSADVPGGSCIDHGASVNCSLPSLSAGASLPVSFVMTTDRIQSSPAERTLTLEAHSAEGDYLPANNRVVLFTTIQTTLEYFNDFSSGADEHWSPQTTGAPVSGLDVLGPFGEEEAVFNWEDLPYHDRAYLCYDLYVTGPWGGTQCQSGGKTLIEPDVWTHFIDEEPVLVTTFANRPQCKQAFPKNYPGALNPPQSGAAEIGEFDGDSTVQDARYRVCYEREHTMQSLYLLFKGLDLDRMQLKQWSIDNVSIKFFYNAAFDRTYLPLLLR